jgi:hypothetical protein
MQWLLGINDEAATIDKPFQTEGKYDVHIVESWEPPIGSKGAGSSRSRTIHAYSNAPVVELFVNSKSFGRRSIVRMVEGDSGSYAEWLAVPYEAGNLTVVAYTVSSSSAVVASEKPLYDRHLRSNTVVDADRFSEASLVASDTRLTNSRAAGIELVLDCPSPGTGTGDALFLDGQDMALVGARVVDEHGEIVVLGRHNITFVILDGPGIIQGTANGNVSSYDSHTTPWSVSYHGLTRAVIRVTSRAGLSPATKHWMYAVEPTYDENMELNNAIGDIYVHAASPGLMPSQVLRIRTSTSAIADPLIVAHSLAGLPVDFGF